MGSFIFVFLDGFGLGDTVSDNPLFTDGIRILEKIGGQKLIRGIGIQKQDILFKGIDANLGLEGLPQSATGQTALLTGKNASQILGYHLPAFPNTTLIELIGEHNLLKKLSDYGFSTSFANAYSDCYFQNAMQRKKAHSVTTHCMLSAKLKHRTINDLLNDNAVYWDINRESIKKRLNMDIKPIDPFDAGVHLAKIAKNYDLLLYESFSTDIIGHKCDYLMAQNILNILDSFFNGIIGSMDKTDNLLICSDHGNIEDLSAASHTRNPVPLIVIGPDSNHFGNVERIEDVTPAILDLFNRKLSKN